jgi:Major Facilitator Superfamily
LTTHRTTAFSQIKAAQLISQLIFVPLGGALIAVDPWIPMLISTAFMVVGFVAAVLFIPEIPPRNENSREGGEAEPLIPATDIVYSSRRRKLCAGVVEIRDWARAHWRVLPIAFCLFLFYLGEAGSSNSLLLLYVSKRLGWSLSQAGKTET